MDKLVRRVTVVQGSGENRRENVVYRSEDDEGEDEGFGMPRLNRLERTVRHMLKAQMIAAQEAYQRHLDSVEKGGNRWVLDEPMNFMKARRKAMKEMRKASPFRVKIESDGDEDEDKGD